MNEHPIRNIRRVALRAALIGVLGLGLTGCLLRLTGGFAFTNDLGTFIDFIFEDVSTAYCTEVRDSETGNTVVECLYSIESGELEPSQRTSTAELISEFGVFGLLIDPLILQVPLNASFADATVDDGTGPQDLRITETASFDVQPGVRSTAEPGHKFWIIELPEALEAALPASLDYSFQYRSPPEADGVTTIKAIYTVRVEVNGDTFYLPLYPCTSDFAEVPAINIDVSASDGSAPGASLNNLIFQLAFLQLRSDPNEELTCQNEVYDLTPLSGDVPLVDAGPDAAINEGESFTSAGSFSDADSSAWTATVNYGDGSGVQTLALNTNGTFLLTHTYADDGVYVVTVEVTDDEGGVGSDMAIVIVSNLPPTVDAGPDSTLEEGDTFLSAGSFTDPGADTWTATVDYGEGAGPQTLPLNADGTFVLDNLYEDDGVYTVTVTVTDDEGGVGSDAATVTVNAASQGPLACDVDNDGDVDRDDISAIIAVRNQPAAPGDPRDNDGNGVITVLDARQCVIKCTLPGCAVR